MAANDDTQRQNATKPRIKHSLSTYAMTLVFEYHELLRTRESGIEFVGILYGAEFIVFSC